VDDIANSIGSAEDVRRQLAYIDEARAHFFRSGASMMAEGRGESSCLRVQELQGERLVERELIDLHVAFGMTTPGNGHPGLSARVAHYVEAGTPAIPGTIAHRLLEPTLRALRAISGMPQGMTLFANDGTVAVEAAVRAALRAYAKRHGKEDADGADPYWDSCKVVVADRGYHGSSGLPRSFVRSPQARAGFGPLFSNSVELPYGDIGAMERTFEAEDVAVVLLEPVLGAGGCIAPPAGYLAAVRDLCRKRGAIFIADETKSGFGMLGEYFYTAAEGLEPDVICGGKSAAAGILPFSFAIGTRDVMESFDAAWWGVTWSASPLQCMALLSLIHMLDEHEPGAPSILSETRRKAVLMDDMLSSIAAKHPEAVKRVDGLGLMRSIETIFPAPRLVVALRARGVHTAPMVHPTDIASPVVPYRIPIAPAVTITDAQIRMVGEALDEALTELEAGSTG
jgi:acetylornithine/succinyldiaminopimelate/putrescine aminotransferase